RPDAAVGRADPPGRRDAGELAAGRRPHHRAHGRGGVLHPAVQPALQPARCRDGAMSARLSDRLIDLLLYGSVAAVLVFFYIPIFTLIGFSFQEGRYLTLPFEGVSLRWYGELFRNAAAGNALWNSTLIAIVAMLFSTALGTAAAIVAVRYRFRGKTAFIGLAAAPLAFPQLLMGVVLLLWFSVLGR